MSSVIILKKIENYSPENIIEAVKKAARKSNMYCYYIKSEYDHENTFITAEGTLSVVDEGTLEKNKDITSVKVFSFNVNQVVDSSYDSYTWLTQDESYFWAIDIENINHEYEFIYRFIVEYFKDNAEDHLWFDDGDWFYTTEEICQLKQMEYDPEWCIKK